MYYNCDKCNGETKVLTYSGKMDKNQRLVDKRGMCEKCHKRRMMFRDFWKEHGLHIQTILIFPAFATILFLVLLIISRM